MESSDKAPSSQHDIAAANAGEHSDPRWWMRDVVVGVDIIPRDHAVADDSPVRISMKMAIHPCLACWLAGQGNPHRHGNTMKGWVHGTVNRPKADCQGKQCAGALFLPQPGLPMALSNQACSMEGQCPGEQRTCCPAHGFPVDSREQPGRPHRDVPTWTLSWPSAVRETMTVEPCWCWVFR